VLRLPRFSFHAPSQLGEAARILSDSGPGAMLLAGGTDLLPNMKRGQQKPDTLVALGRIESLRQAIVDSPGESGVKLGAGLKLAEIAANPMLRQRYAALWQAAGLVASPQLRNMATLGGNLCLDTRCSYYDQSEHWRGAVDNCLKTGGDVCWVVTKSAQCRAVSSTDTAPALLALGACVRLVSAVGERRLPLADFYFDDGIEYSARRPDEILAEVLLEPADGWKSTYWKLRRRGSIDFPLLSVAAAVRADPGGTVLEARLVLGALASRPVVSAGAADFLCGKKLDDEVIEETGRMLADAVKPVNNTDMIPLWRKKAVPHYVRHALRELRGDDLGDLRRRCGGAL